MAEVRINLGEKVLIVKTDLFDKQEEIDIDKFLQVDYKNLIAEIITFPVILNKLGILLSQMDNKLAEAELDLKIWKAKKRESTRLKYESEKKKWTIDIVDDLMRSDAIYKAKYVKFNSVKKQRDYINSIYWSAKAKDDKLSKLSLTLQPGMVDTKDIVPELNGIRISIREPRIK